MAKKSKAKPAVRRAPAAKPPAAAKVARERTVARRAPDVQSAAEAARGKYVYCVIQSAEPLKFGAAGIGDNGSEIHTIHHRDLAAVVSDVPLGVLDSTRENVLAHERVNEIVMRDHTVIPMSFGTVFKTRDDIVQLLRSAYDAFGDVLQKMGDKMIMNAAFLVSRDQETAFDSRVKSIAAEHDKLTFKYTGPWPPYNFVNIRLKLERV